MAKLVLIRHGQSEWNLANKFTGWIDVDLSEKGVEQAKNAGKALKEHGIQFDYAYTSVLKRAIKTLHYALEECDQLWIPETKTWRLNERHYGALQGLNKKATAEKYGDEQVHIWRRSYDVLPPLLTADDEGSALHDRRYANLDPRTVPGGENLKVTLERVIPLWQDEIAPKPVSYTHLDVYKRQVFFNNQQSRIRAFFINNMTHKYGQAQWSVPGAMLVFYVFVVPIKVFQ